MFYNTKYYQVKSTTLVAFALKERKGDYTVFSQPAPRLAFKPVAHTEYSKLADHGGSMLVVSLGRRFQDLHVAPLLI